MQPPTPSLRSPGVARAIVVAVVLAILVGMLAGTGEAAKGGKTITIGESNDEEQRQELLAYFGATGDDKVEIVTVAQTKKAMKNVSADEFDSAFSSTALTCRELGEGIDVTTRNIVQITPALYAMALVTAGVGDAEVLVAAPDNAPAKGMTALAGIFQSWQSNPCGSSQTTKARQELALRELALAIDISTTVLSANDTSVAGNFVIDVQRNVVIDRATEASDIEAIVANQVGVYGFTLPDVQREALVTLMVDLQALDLDWSTFSDGWTIEYGNETIAMRGEGIAIANAQASATAERAVEKTAVTKKRKIETRTAVAAAEETATAAVRETEVAVAAASAVAGETAVAEVAAATQAVATEVAAAAVVEQTRVAEVAAAPPTATALPTALPTPMPEPVASSGKLTSVSAPVLIVDVSGQAATYAVGDATTITRDGKPATLAELQPGDALELTVDPSTSQLRSVVASAPKGSPLGALSKLLLGLPLLALIPIAVVIKGKGGGDPFIVKRVSQ